MRYYTKKSKSYNDFKIKIPKPSYRLIILIMILVLFNSILYLFNKRILPTVLSIGEVKMKSEAIRIINEETMKVYEENFKYDDIINIEKDDEGNIKMIRSDTVKQNTLVSKVVLSCDEKLSELGEIGVKIPLGYLTNNIMFYKLGPKINIKMQEIGSIETSYESIFESAGINQTRHKIYLNLKATIRVIVPLNSKDVEITSQIPISDTIIVGEIPSIAINMK